MEEILVLLASNRVGNNNLKFEKALKSEIGIEAAFFNNWLTMSSSVFQDVRKDFIYGDLTTVGTAFLRILMQEIGHQKVLN
jgi:outer membrane receptor for monomeric catechols